MSKDQVSKDAKEAAKASLIAFRRAAAAFDELNKALRSNPPPISERLGLKRAENRQHCEGSQ